MELPGSGNGSGEHSLRRSGDHGGRGAAGARANPGDLVGDPNQRPQRDLRIPIVPGRIGLVGLEIDAQRRPFGAGAGQAVDDPGAALEQDPDALALADRAVDRVRGS